MVGFLSPTTANIYAESTQTLIFVTSIPGEGMNGTQGNLGLNNNIIT